MHVKCVQHGLYVRREDVRTIMCFLYPDDMNSRRRKRLTRRTYFAKGPNYIWHVDGYDKIKPYGICISGCIDGYSRKVLWLRAGSTNNDPYVVGGYFVDAVERLGGCPTIVRTDFGTENVCLREIQIMLRPSDQSPPSFIAGASTMNQRIESWWGMLRRQCTQYWMNLFSSLKDTGYFDGTFLDKNLIQFCFMDIIQVVFRHF